MTRMLLSLLTGGAILWSGARVSGDTVFRSAYHDYRVVTVVDALVQPWSIAFLPGGDVLITETDIGTYKGWPFIPTPATSGRTSTAHRAAMS